MGQSLSHRTRNAMCNIAGSIAILCYECSLYWRMWVRSCSDPRSLLLKERWRRFVTCTLDPLHWVSYHIIACTDAAWFWFLDVSLGYWNVALEQWVGLSSGVTTMCGLTLTNIGLWLDDSTLITTISDSKLLDMLSIHSMMGFGRHRSRTGYPLVGLWEVNVL